MADGSPARKEKKKVPFLQAFACLGKISDAARAVRISRDAVHDWRRNDPAFAAAFLVAKREAITSQSKAMHEAVGFFSRVAKPFVAEALWAKFQTALAIAVSQERFKAQEASRPSLPPPTAMVDIPMLAVKRGPDRATEPRSSGMIHHRL